MEEAPDYKQIIPVFVLLDEATGDVVIYQRKSKHTEQRLAGSFTPLFGGHIDTGDKSMKMFEDGNVLETINGNTIPTTINNALEREFTEETALTFEDVPMTFEGFIYDEGDAVGRVHLGLCFFGYTKITAETLHTISSTDEIDNCFLANKTDIEDMMADENSGLEGWARIVFEHIEKECNNG